MIEVIQLATGIMDALLALLSSLETLITKVIAGASVMAAFMPPASNDSVWSKIHTGINWIAFNFKNAKNKEAE
jgi:hypothetical protein